MTEVLPHLIERLSSPLSESEIAEGWTNESKAAIANYFLRLKEGSASAKAGLIRGLDAWGISSGALFDECLSVNSVLMAAASVRPN